MPKLIEETGKKHFRKGNKWKDSCAIYECDCGKQYEAVISIVNSGKASQKCSECSEITRTSKIKASKIKHGMSYTKLKSVYMSMKTRCENPDDKNYNNYGLRGISICNEWKNDSSSFYAWALNNGYAEGLSIDRIDNNGNYEPSNCRWVSRTIQAQNKRQKKRDLPIGTTLHGRVTKKFRVQISAGNERFSLGVFSTKYEAAKAYNDFCDQHETSHTRNNLEEWINE